MARFNTLSICALIEKQDKVKEYIEKISERIVSLRASIDNPDTDRTLIELLGNTLDINLELYTDLTGEDYDKRYS